MKQDTKKLVLIGGAALAALYAYSTMGGEDYAGMGGGGGLPLLPTLPEAAGAGAVAPIVVNIPGMEAPIGWETEGEDFEAQIRKYIHPDDVEPLLQKKISVETYLDIVPPGEYSEAPPTDPKRVYGSLGGKGGGVEIKKTESKPWYAPWTWDASEAVKNYQGWATRSTERTLSISKSDKSRTDAISVAKKIDTKRNRPDIEYKSFGRDKKWSGGLTSTTKGSGIHFTTTGTGTLRKRPKKSASAPGSPD